MQKFVYDGQDVIQDLDDSEQVVTSYLNGPGIDDKIRQTDANGNLYYVADHLGSTIALTDDSGAIVEGIGYDSFGNSTGSSLTRYTYTGREFDADTGLYYYRARWYDPQVGRFISEDPIGFKAADVNLYAYVLNNPVNFRDPTGTQRADRDRPGDIEWARGLRDAIDRMPRQESNCGCQTKPRNPLLLAGTIAVMDGPPPGPLDILALAALLTYASAASQTVACTPGKVIPFPPPQRKPKPLFPPIYEPGEICPFKEQVGRICIYQCKKGTIAIWLVDKTQPCPSHAGRT